MKVLGISGSPRRSKTEDVKGFFAYNEIECVGSVTAQGAVPCFSCGYGDVSRISGVKRFFGGDDSKASSEIIPCLDKQPEVISEAKSLGKTLRERLNKKLMID
jgi:hypothetical protein